MNNLSTLKIYAATYVTESDLPAKDKLWLIDFIREGEHGDILNILEGEYKLPQITEYEAEMLNTYILEVKPPPIPKKKPGAKPLRIRPNLGTSKVISAVQKKRAAEKGFRKVMPDASKESVKAAKHAVKPYGRDVLKAVGKSGVKIATKAGGIALAAAGAHSLYQKYMSKAARACKGKPNQAACMEKFKKKASTNKNIFKIKRLRVSKNDCINSRNPVLCRKRIDERIQKLKENLIVEAGMLGPLGRAFDVLFIFELGSMAYKRFFSKAAKACKGSPDRRLCVLRYKIKAKEVQMKTIRSKASLCSKDANPANCKNKIMRKVQSLSSDINMLKQELS
jgi:hypothetical protein